MRVDSTLYVMATLSYRIRAGLILGGISIYSKERTLVIAHNEIEGNVISEVWRAQETAKGGLGVAS